MEDQRIDAWIPGPSGFDLRAWVAQLPRYGWTADMVRQLPEPFRFEVIDGELLLPDDVWEFKTKVQ